MVGLARIHRRTECAGCTARQMNLPAEDEKPPQGLISEWLRPLLSFSQGFQSLARVT